jgi:membrane-bound ClpP family serine protease
MPNDLNLKWHQRASVVLVLLSVLLFCAGVFNPALFAPGVLGLLGVVTLNLGFYRFLAARWSWRFAVTMFPLHLLFYCYSALGFLYGLGWHFLARPGTSTSPCRPQ